MREKVKTFEEIGQIAAELRSAGRSVVLTNGCFDLLHVGHIRCLAMAKAEGEVLVVGLNSDSSVRNLKGPSRPLVPEAERAEMLTALESVDYVVVFGESGPHRLIETVRPHVHAKGGDYTEAMLPEAPLVKSLGGRIAIIPWVMGRSTTELVRRAQSSAGQAGKVAEAPPVVWCVVPARYGSTRLAGKALLPIDGKPMIEHVYTRARQARVVSEVLVATDDERIRDVVTGFGGKAVMTSAAHRTGTDRIAEAVRDVNCDIIVNVQGDEPLIHPGAIEEAVRPMLEDPSLEMSTLKTLIATEEDLHDPNVVKVVTNSDGYALYFSRCPIPCVRDRGSEVIAECYRHIGLYVYRREFLLRYAAMERTPLEKTESLEQLRALENGYRIKVVPTRFASPGVDTIEDLEHVRKMMANSQNPGVKSQRAECST